MDHLPKRIFLVGPSGTGKSTVARLVGERIGFGVSDIDALIAERIGMSISDFFGRFGEPAFRAIESEILAVEAANDNVVIATGGGVVLSETNWRTMRPESVIIGLAGEPEVLAARVQSQTERDGSHAARPLLTGDAVKRLRDQLKVRQPFYSMADVTIDTSDKTIEDVVDAATEAARGAVMGGLVPALSISTPIERSDIFISQDAIRALPDLISRRWPSARRIWMVSDENVFEHWGETVGGALSVIGEVHVLQVPAGEDSKSLARAGELVTEMTEKGVTRRDVVIALGGGVVGDLGGFAAAIGLRGLPLVQLPTSLLAMVDSSVGGKTGVNTPAGKNLVGAFYQPGMVLIDPAFLRTLPREEFRSGMAEVLKHAFIQPSTPLGGETLMKMLESASSLDPVPDQLLVDLLRENVAIKHSVVEADERESRLRMILNFGHTAGHAIEADGYRYRHGEAVALGMQVALEIGRQMDRISQERIDRFTSLIAGAGLPTSADVSVEAVLRRMTHDKKNVDGQLHWILPRHGGPGVEIVTGVHQDVVRAAVERLLVQPASRSVAN